MQGLTRKRVALIGFADEEAERAAYRVELERLKVYVSMGEGI